MFDCFVVCLHMPMCLCVAHSHIKSSLLSGELVCTVVGCTLNSWAMPRSSKASKLSSGDYCPQGGEVSTCNKPVPKVCACVAASQHCSMPCCAMAGCAQSRGACGEKQRLCMCCHITALLQHFMLLSNFRCLWEEAKSVSVLPHHSTAAAPSVMNQNSSSLVNKLQVLLQHQALL